MSAIQTREFLQKELNRIPDNLLEDIHEYLKFLKFKTGTDKEQVIETTYASERVLGKDWNRKEEDQAWQDL